MFKKFLNWVLPYTCILCGDSSDRQQDLCNPCYLDLPSIPHACMRCAIPLSSHARVLCGMCLQKPPPFDVGYALYVYQNPIAKLILELKFNQALHHARLLGELLAEKLQTFYRYHTLPNIIIPIPLHAARLKERGFNQAVEIARPVSQQLKIPLDVDTCLRIKPTLPQATLHASARGLNVRHAFILKKLLTGQRIAVLDDVITTGSTIHEFCRMLKKHGAASIDIWCVARPKIL